MTSLQSIQPVVYLSPCYPKKDFSYQALLQLGLPLVVSPNIDQAIRDALPEGSYQTLSFNDLISACDSKAWTHIINIESGGEEFFHYLQTELKQVIGAAEALVFYLPQQTKKQHASLVLQKLLDLDDSDYRRLSGVNAIYPIQKISHIKLAKDDGFNSQRILIHCLRHHERFHEVQTPIDFKPPQAKGYLKKIMFDTWLIALSSLQRNQRPMHSALSIMMGAFLACSPFYGLQTLLIIAFALIFRLSFPVAFLGSQISLPPFYSVLVPLQIYVGATITGQELNLDGSWLDIARSHFVSWTLGWLLLGGAIALVMGTGWYVMMMNIQKKRQSPTF